jgi:hypothetical protein
LEKDPIPTRVSQLITDFVIQDASEPGFFGRVTREFSNVCKSCQKGFLNSVFCLLSVAQATERALEKVFAMSLDVF